MFEFFEVLTLVLIVVILLVIMYKTARFHRKKKQGEKEKQIMAEFDRMQSEIDRITKLWQQSYTL